VLIKDNHIKAAGGIKNAVKLVRNNIGHTVKIEVEAADIKQVREALEVKADIIMLDNMTIEEIEEAVRIIDKSSLVEVSGNVTLKNLEEICKTGIDVVSVGAITHSTCSLDISLKIK